MYNQGMFKIISAKEISPGFFDFTVKGGGDTHKISSGQFAHVLCGHHTLRRPISICDFDNEAHTFRMVFEVRGDGTKWLSERSAGEELDIIVPLGNGFRLLDKSKKAVFVGGGIGTPPLLSGCRHYGKNADAILGYRSSRTAILTEDFRKVSGNVMISTDDGSLGHHGLVTDLLDKRLREGACDIIYACGPKVMLKAVAQTAEKYGIECQVSLEERMGCGIGACLVCACRIKTKDGEKNKHVCKDGPVFDAREVVW